MIARSRYFSHSLSSVPRFYSTIDEAQTQLRKKFTARNWLTGLGLFGFVTAVYSYSILAVKQDTFDDVVVPSATAQSNSIDTKSTNN
ncbi:hypothetical protein BKA69DRAFT_1091176 [Paraphysoderma sedebokerense]|nr:hypothetical protein BKA69DRAFT_1091176 [Paraphysoderma sedebokerense]